MTAGRPFSPVSVVVLLILLSSGRVPAAETVAQKAMVSGTPTANLRAGPSVDHALKLTLKEGDPVTIQKLDGEWFLVTAADGQQGYIHKNLLRPVENVASQPQVTLEQKSDAVAAPAPVTGSTPTAPASPPNHAIPQSPIAAAASVEAGKARTKEVKAPSLLQMLEGHESEVKIGLLVAGVAFVIGWFCGGHYYIRREHKYRRRLRL